MVKYCFAAAAILAVCGCNTVTDAGSSTPVVLPSPKKPELNAGPMNDKNNGFVGVFGTKTAKNGMQVKFGSDGTVTVDGQTTTAVGTYGATGNTAQASFTKTNVARFDHVQFDLSADGKTVQFKGPLNTNVSLNRTQ
jgi:hypothetical protein